MKIYYYDPNTRAFAGHGDAQESPLEPSVWLMPPNVTQIAPPDFGVGQAPAWNGNEWVAVPNPLPQIPEVEGKRSLMIVTRFQAVAALESIGELDAVEAYFSTADTPKLHKLAWKNTLHFYRISPLVEAVGEMLGLTDEQLDELFESAAGIQV